MGISVGPTGTLVTGDILDVNRQSLESAIQYYDPLLYFKWNPNKNKGYGKWELRRRPEHKSIVESIQLSGVGIHKLEYVEYDIANHIFDLTCLNYRLLDKIKASDMWAKIEYNGKQHRVDNFAKEANTKFYENKDQAKRKMQEDMLYNLKQDKSIIEDFRERLRDGVDPNHLLRYWR